MEKYKQVEYLGYESLGEVWLVENKKTTELFAMKCFKRGHQVHSCIYICIVITLKQTESLVLKSSMIYNSFYVCA